MRNVVFLGTRQAGVPVITLYGCGYTALESETLGENTMTSHAGGSERPDRAPKVSDAFKQGSPVSVVTWSGRRVEGTVCDRDEAGLLLDVDENGNGANGYAFLPWSSVEQVDIREVVRRRVKSLSG